MLKLGTHFPLISPHPGPSPRSDPAVCLLPGPSGAPSTFVQDFVIFSFLSDLPVSTFFPFLSAVLPPELADFSRSRRSAAPRPNFVHRAKSMLAQVLPDLASLHFQPLSWAYSCPHTCCFLCQKCTFTSSLLHAILIILRGFYLVSSQVFLDHLWSE